MQPRRSSAAGGLRPCSTTAPRLSRGAQGGSSPTCLRPHLPRPNLPAAITPGTLSERRTSLIGTSRNRRLTAALFEAALGAAPLDAGGKASAGSGLLWCANGFRFDDGHRPGQQFLAVEGPDGQPAFPPAEGGEVLPARPDLFALNDERVEPVQRLLLNSIRRARRRPREAAAAALEP